MGGTDGMGWLRGAGDGNARLRALAVWWAQAAKESRFDLLQRIVGQKTPQKGDPTLKDLQLAILAAEISTGESEIR